jgi:hypothetical protein
MKTKVARVSPKERARLQRIHDRKNFFERIERAKQPKPPVLMLTMNDIAKIKPERGELIWTDGKDVEKRLFFEITDWSADDPKRAVLRLYGEPVSYVEIHFYPRKQTNQFLCLHCHKWQKTSVIIPWASGVSQGNYCSECYYEGTPDQHQMIRRGSDSGPFGPVRFPVEMYGEEKPLRISKPKRGGNHGR